MKLPRDLSAADLEKALRPGTLRAILGEVMAHHHLTLEQVLQRLGLV